MDIDDLIILCFDLTYINKIWIPFSSLYLEFSNNL